MINYIKISLSGLLITVKAVLLCFLIISIPPNLKAQPQPEKPPRPIVITTYQHLEFGSVIMGNSGGTVIIYPNGTRSSTGDLILPPMGSSGKEAVFNIKAAPGTLITILFGSASLSWSSYSMNLVLGPTDPVSPFVTSLQQGESTFVHVGGTLSVGNPLENPAGNYSGSFTVTFIQQ